MNQTASAALVRYIRKAGSRYNQEQTDVIGTEISRLTDIYESVSKEELVDFARDSDSPLHSFFDWNNRSAAEKYRQSQAGYMFRMIQIEVRVSKAIVVPMNIVSSIKDEVGNRRYIPTQLAVADTTNREFIVKEAWRGLLGWVTRYEAFMESEPVFRNVRLALRKAGYLP